MNCNYTSPLIKNLFKSNSKHPFTLISVRGRMCQIDTKMVQLIMELNTVNLKTTTCCQGDNSKPASVSIELPFNSEVSISDNVLTIKWMR